VAEALLKAAYNKDIQDKVYHQELTVGTSALKIFGFGILTYADEY
jgi:hypothetical protein